MYQSPNSIETIIYKSSIFRTKKGTKWGISVRSKEKIEIETYFIVVKDGDF